jgi:CheY-like chemotaxis protein
MSGSQAHCVVVLVARADRERTRLSEALEEAGYLVAAYDHASPAIALTADLSPEAVVVASEDDDTRALLESTTRAVQIVGKDFDCVGGRLAFDPGDPTRLLALLRERCAVSRSSHSSDRSSSGTSGHRRSAFAIIVEDDVVLATVLAGALADEGYATRVAINAAEGRALIAEHPGALLILDLTLPDGFGGDVLADAAMRGALPPTVIVSTFGLAEIVARKYDAELVRKPFELDAFLAAVERMRTLGRPSRRSLGVAS